MSKEGRREEYEGRMKEEFEGSGKEENEERMK